LGTDGIDYLCRGLRTNISLRQLHVAYCNIGKEAGRHLAGVLANTQTGLLQLNLQGNRINQDGFRDLCIEGLLVNTKLEKLNMADNMIDQTPDDEVALEAFRDCLANENSKLSSVDFMYNRIGVKGAKILIEALPKENKRITEFLVDLTLPSEQFTLLMRKGGGKGKKGGKKGGKKKKK